MGVLVFFFPHSCLGFIDVYAPQSQLFRLSSWLGHFVVGSVYLVVIHVGLAGLKLHRQTRGVVLTSSNTRESVKDSEKDH